jgi:DNA gyrase/topoisomerase IV subunit A
VGAGVLLANTGGYGFIATVENMMSRQRGGKAFIDVGEGEQLCRPSLVGGASGAEPMPAATHVACASTGGRILTFDIAELKSLPKGGRGLTLIDLERQGHARGRRGLHAQREDRRHRPRRQGARRNAGNPHAQQRARQPCAQGQGGRPRLQADQHRAGSVMGGIDISVIGLVVIAVVTGIGSFWFGRRMRLKRGAKQREKERIAAQANETRQQRRARERKERG